MATLKGFLSREVGASIDAFIDSFTASLRSSTPITIASIFEVFDIHTSAAVRRALINRGSLTTTGGVLSNTASRDLPGTFHDDNFGTLRITFPAAFEATATSNNGKVVVDCREKKIPVEFTTPQPIPIDRQQFFFQLVAIKGQEVRYFFSSRSDAILELKLVYGSDEQVSELLALKQQLSAMAGATSETADGNELRIQLLQFAMLAGGPECCPPFCMSEPVEPSDDEDEPEDE